jgi:hypothetical protein
MFATATEHALNISRWIGLWLCDSRCGPINALLKRPVALNSYANLFELFDGVQGRYPRCGLANITPFQPYDSIDFVHEHKHEIYTLMMTIYSSLMICNKRRA